MKILYLFFIIALALDLILVPLIGSVAWFPIFTLSLLPFIFSFGKKRMVWIIFIAVLTFFWLTTGLNLGVITLSLGLVLFFERWLLPKSFHRDTWQALAISSFGVLDFGILLWLLTFILDPKNNFLDWAIVVSFILTTILAVLLNFIFYKKFKVNKSIK